MKQIILNSHIFTVNWDTESFKYDEEQSINKEIKELTNGEMRYIPAYASMTLREISYRKKVILILTINLLLRVLFPNKHNAISHKDAKYEASPAPFTGEVTESKCSEF